MTMKLIYLFVIMSLTSCNAQKKGDVTYLLPDDVEIELNEHLSQSTDFNYMVLFSSKDFYELFVINDNEYAKRPYGSFITATNRNVMVNGKNYPLLLDYDFNFSTTDTINIGEFGKRDGMVKKVQPIFHGYSIKFTNKGIVNQAPK
jgi:hypothetical protein